jgi:hypothetical protein
VHSLVAEAPDSPADLVFSNREEVVGIHDARTLHPVLNIELCLRPHVTHRRRDGCDAHPSEEFETRASGEDDHRSFFVRWRETKESNFSAF